MGKWGLLLASLALVWAASAFADASNALVIVGSDSASKIVDQINTRLAISSAIQKLSDQYTSTNVISSSDPSAADVASAISNQSSADQVDLIVLSGAKSLSPRGQFANLRLVYLAGESSLELAREWENAGARIVIAQSGFTSGSWLCSERFISDWASGASARAAAEDAQAFSASNFQALSDVAQAQATPGLSMIGQNLDLSGEIFDPVLVQATPSQPLQEFADAKSAVSQTPFQQAALAASTSLLPAMKVDTSQVKKTQDFLNQVGPVAWSQMQNLFPATPPSGGPGSPGWDPVQDGDPIPQQIWIDGEFLQYIVQPLEKYLGNQTSAMMKYVKGVKVDRTPSELQIRVYFTQAFDFQLKDPSVVHLFQVDAVHVPEMLQISLGAVNGVVVLRGLNQPQEPNGDRFYLRLKIPLASMKIYPRDLSIQLVSGDLQLDAGILGDHIGLVADAKIFAKKIQPHVDFWKSVEEDLPIFDWPDLTFSQKAPAALVSPAVLSQR